MFDAFKQIFKPNNKDLRKRVIFTLVALMIFSLGNAITVPGMQEITGDLGFLELLNAMSGGGLKQFSIFALGVMPYITASIITQLLQMDIIPYFKELKELGEEGRRKMNKITRYLGIFFAFVEGYIYSIMFIGGKLPASEYIVIATILTGGTAFLLWLGDQITNKGIGNGISLIIMAGIVNTLPTMFSQAFKALVPASSNLFIGSISFALFVALYFFIIVGVIFAQESERRIPIQYSNRTVSSYGGRSTYLPLKLNSAGVIPVIFASALFAIPTTLTYFLKSQSITMFINNYLTTKTPVGFIIYILLIIMFTYFYTYIVINPEELSKNLNESGGYIPGIRPGKETIKYVSRVLARITFLGALFIATIAALPIIFTAFTKLPSIVQVGGTSILIVVGVVLETYKQLESTVASRGYNKR
ncbi:MAG: preprotein translocase subunit SecY [Bacilli bacterium]